MSGGACFVCHGMQGKGDGPAAPGLVYVSGKHQGKKVSPANLHHSDWFKGGRRPEDVAAGERGPRGGELVVEVGQLDGAGDA